MRFCGIIAILSITLIILPSASAFVTGLENTIRIGETPYELSFFIENKDNANRPLSIQYNFPAEYEILEQPTWIGANSREEIKVRIYPDNGLEGSEYTGTLIIKLNGNRAEKNVNLLFFKENRCSINTQITKTEKGFLVIFENNSFKDKIVRLEEIKGLPQDWKTNTPKNFVVQGNSSTTGNIEFDNKAYFDGEATLVFECEGSKFTKTAAENKDNNPIAGFAVLGAVPDFAGGELAIIIILTILAAILMIAFIARLVKLFNNKQTRTEVEK